MTAWNAWDRVRRAARKAVLEALVLPHFLRHSHGTHALHRGDDLATVRETSGRASLATTGRHLHARPEKSSGDYLAV
jgi:integrase/recombinase XerD